MTVPVTAPEAVRICPQELSFNKRPRARTTTEIDPECVRKTKKLTSKRALLLVINAMALRWRKQL